MTSVLLVAGIGVVVAGLLAIGFGIPVKEFSFGNTLVLAGAVAVCTGLIMLSLAVVVRELKAIAQRLGPANSAAATRGRGEAPAVFGRPEPAGEPSADGPLFSRDQPALEHAGEADPAAPPLPSATSSATPPLPPWQEEAARTRQRGSAPSAPAAVESASETKPRRNLLFSSSSRRERERAAARTPDSIASDLDSASSTAAATAAPAPPEASPRTFDDAWPAAESGRSEPYRRSARTPSTFSDAAASGATPPPAAEDPSEVTVLKSGVVDGMAYSLYSDGSIEAQMPEGMMRFASISELRAHLDQRP
jgi:hypothetical protein